MSNKKSNLPPDDQPIPLSAVPPIVEEIWQRRVSRQAVYQWVREGRKLRSGGTKALQVEQMTDGKIALKTKLQFNRLYTTIAWLRDFVEAC